MKEQNNEREGKIDEEEWLSNRIRAEWIRDSGCRLEGSGESSGLKEWIYIYLWMLLHLPCI